VALYWLLILTNIDSFDFSLRRIKPKTPTKKIPKKKRKKRYQITHFWHEFVYIIFVRLMCDFESI
jgi:hypothetical protein